MIRAAVTAFSLSVAAAFASPLAAETEYQIDAEALAALYANPVIEDSEGSGRESRASLFHSIAASNFDRRVTTTTVAYGGAGCVYVTGGEGILTADLQLPHDALVDFLRLYFDDLSAAYDARAVLYAFDGAGNFSQIAAAESSGTPGMNSVGIGFSYTVDNIGQALALVLNFQGATTGDLRICRVRLRYTPVEIFSDGFEFGDASRWSAAVP